MFACVHVRESLSPSALADLPLLGAAFSPQVERTSDDTIVFSIQGLNRLIGSIHDIASAISQRGQELGFQANLAIAAHPDTAILAARQLPGVTILTPGREVDWLGRIPVAAIADDALVETLDRWGIRTLGELTGLPPIGLVERLGEAGDRLRRLALGEISRPLRLPAEGAVYQARTELDEGLWSVEEILFVLSPLLHGELRKMERNAHAVHRIHLQLVLDNRRESRRSFELPLPSRSAAVILKQIQLDLEAHPLGGRLVAATLILDPAAPRTIQGGLYRPPSPEPDRLHNVLTRIGALVGPENVGSPVVLDSYQPDAFAVRPYQLTVRELEAIPDLPLRLSLRVFRPPLTAKVRLDHGRPVWVRATRVEGEVEQVAGPWRTSGGWWSESPWERDEWDVMLRGGDAYRLYWDGLARAWFLGGLYD